MPDSSQTLIRSTPLPTAAEARVRSCAGNADRAWLCLRCGTWADAAEAALAIPRAGTMPDALEWLACARYRLGGLEAARSALLALAWHGPSRFAAALGGLRDELLERDWQRFNGACEWEGVPDAELPDGFRPGIYSSIPPQEANSTASMRPRPGPPWAR